MFPQLPPKYWQYANQRIRHIKYWYLKNSGTSAHKPTWHNCRHSQRLRQMHPNIHKRKLNWIEQLDATSETACMAYQHGDAWPTCACVAWFFNFQPGPPSTALCGKHLRGSRNIDRWDFIVVGVAVHLASCLSTYVLLCHWNPLGQLYWVYHCCITLSKRKPCSCIYIAVPAVEFMVNTFSILLGSGFLCGMNLTLLLEVSLKLFESIANIVQSRNVTNATSTYSDLGIRRLAFYTEVGYLRSNMPCKWTINCESVAQFMDGDCWFAINKHSQIQIHDQRLSLT